MKMNKIANAKDDAAIIASLPGSVSELTQALRAKRIAENESEGDFVRDAYNSLQRLKRAKKIRYHHGSQVWRLRQTI